jgi:thiol-disulfide isomerase/thioredoxin
MLFSLLLALICLILHTDAFLIGKTLGVRFQRNRVLSATPKFKNFDDMLQQLEVPVLVDFYAQWCGPCVMMQPILEEVAQRFEDEAKVGHLLKQYSRLSLFHLIDLTPFTRSQKLIQISLLH